MNKTIFFNECYEHKDTLYRQRRRSWGGGGSLPPPPPMKILVGALFSGAPSASKVAQVKMCRGTNTLWGYPTHITNISDKQKKRREIGQKSYKKTSKKLHYIYQNSSYPQNVGGGGHLILCPPPEKTWGGGTRPPVPPPPGFAPMPPTSNVIVKYHDECIDLHVYLRCCLTLIVKHNIIEEIRKILSFS